MSKYNFILEGIYEDIRWNGDNAGKPYTVSGIVEIDKHPTQYGNGKMLILKPEHGEPQFFDIRYDTEYSESNERWYIEEVLRQRYQQVQSVSLNTDENPLVPMPINRNATCESAQAWR